MAAKLRRLPRLLLHVLSIVFLVGQAYVVDRTFGVHPVVLLPGNIYSQIQARLADAYELPSPLCAARKGDGRWHQLWKNATAPDAEGPCFADQLRLTYDHAGGDYHNTSGIHTRALSFGSTCGFLADEPADKELRMGKLVYVLVINFRVP